MYCDWKKITSLAYLNLLEQNICELPIPAKKIKCNGVIITSYQNYAKKTGCSISAITLGHELDDAFFVGNIRPGISLILYNKDKYEARLKHSLWHEVGHYKCEHKKHGSQEEIEAHFFAAQANAPTILIKELSKRGYQITAAFLMRCFGLSNESAQKKIEYLGKYEFEHVNDYDDLILKQFSQYIDKHYPPKQKQSLDTYFEDMEKERQGWH